MNKPLKEIVAREGLVLLGFGIVFLILQAYLYFKWADHFDYYQKKVKDNALIVTIFLYCLYLLIRFIIWSIKTLKEK